MYGINLMEDFYEQMEGVNLDVYGVLGKNDTVYSLGTDTKIIGRIFEILSQPVLEHIAMQHGMTLTRPVSQTAYPDFTFMRSPDSKEKIAIDIKTTYVTDSKTQIKFTLGSYCSYMRNETKNIQFPYSDYSKHYVIGFVYRRNANAQEGLVYNLGNHREIKVPYLNTEYFIQEKYRISGDKPGSGNTENIGSISTLIIEDFKEGIGPFSSLGEDIYNLYWSNYPKYRDPNPQYNSLEEFAAWLPNHVENLHILPPSSITNVLEKMQKVFPT